MGGVLNAYTSREQTAFHARILKARCAAGAGHDRRHPDQPRFRAGRDWSASAKWCCRSWARRATRPTTSSSIICRPRSIQDQPLGWSILGEEATVAAFDRDMLKAYMASQYRAGGMTLIASGAVAHDEIVRAGGRQIRRPQSRPGRGATAPAQLCRRRRPRRSRIWSRRISLTPFPASPSRSGLFCGPDLRHGAGRRHVLAPVPGGAGEARPLLFHLCLLQRFPGWRLSRRLCRHRRGRGGRNLRRDGGRDGSHDRRSQRSRSWPAPGPSSRSRC